MGTGEGFFNGFLDFFDIFGVSLRLDFGVWGGGFGVGLGEGRRGAGDRRGRHWSSAGNLNRVRVRSESVGLMVF